MLEQAGIAFTLHEYLTGGGDRSCGEAVAEALGLDPGRVFKTLVASVDGSTVVAIVPVSGHLSMKKIDRTARTPGGGDAQRPDRPDRAATAEIGD